MFKFFQEVCHSGLQRSPLLPSVVGLKFVSDEVPEQAEVSSFFFRGLKVLCLQVLAHRWLPATKNRDERNYHAD
jgi:oligoribonuclease (3'-5' exoribonuclease)